MFTIVNTTTQAVVSQWYPTREQCVAEAYSLGLITVASPDFPGDVVNTKPLLRGHIIIEDKKAD